MFIIFGTKGRVVKKNSGRFYCPQCEGERNYTHYNIANYFTLFFIPIFPYRDIGGYIECNTCKGQFKVNVLGITPEEILQRKIYADAVAGMPLQMINNKLLNQGFNQFDADSALQNLTETKAVKNCSSCNLTYLADANLHSCTSCGGQLL